MRKPSFHLHAHLAASGAPRSAEATRGFETLVSFASDKACEPPQDSSEPRLSGSATRGLRLTADALATCLIATCATTESDAHDDLVEDWLADRRANPSDTAFLLAPSRAETGLLSALARRRGSVASEGAVIVPRAQGLRADRSYVLVTRAMTPATVYVALTRHRAACFLYPKPGDFLNSETLIEWLRTSLLSVFAPAFNARNAHVSDT
jgi:hypothetical protein